MGFSCYTITIINHSLLEHLRNFIFSNRMRPTLSLSHTHTRINVEEDEFHPSAASLVLLPDHLMIKSIEKDRLPVVEYATFRSHNEQEKEKEKEKKEKEAEANDDHDCWCAVCLSRIEESDNVRELGNCKHAFHVDCLDSWIDRGGATCPVCRASLVSGDGEGVNHGKDLWRSQRMVYLFGEDCFMEELQ